MSGLYGSIAVCRVAGRYFFVQSVQVLATGIRGVDYAPEAKEQQPRMDSGTRPVKGTRKMIASMTPVLQPGIFVFCSMLHSVDAKATLRLARGAFAEDEGMSLILPKADADKLRLTYDTEMRQITLMVFTSLTSVGLVAAVTAELTREKIPANVVSATQHDHVFVPTKHAERAMNLLRDLQARASASS